MMQEQDYSYIKVDFMGDNKTFLGSGLMALFSGLTVVDYTAIIGLVISAIFTAWQFYSGRQDAKKQLALLEQLTNKVATGHGTETTTEAITTILTKSGAIK
ncbi:MAG: hypothetical protein [Caudoviricetes sp.]|nr:MAG: hypothetical protein [Caudoviricetes sp.]